jgi:YfiH family protein
MEFMECRTIDEKLGRTGTYRLQECMTDGHHVVWLTFPMLEQADFVTHAFTTRFGGVSEGNFAELNLGMQMEKAAMGEETGERNHRINYGIIASALHRKPEDVVISWQTHTSNVRKVTAEDAGKGLTRERDYRDVDALITNVPGLLLTTLHADCTPLLFIDPVHRAVGAAHSGWRGTVRKTGAETLRAMHEAYGTDPADVLAEIAPTIGAECYEVGMEVAEEFRNLFGEDICTEEKILTPGRAEHMQLDLARANRRILLDAGIAEEHLGISGICTCCHSDIFFSHRGTHGAPRGNLGAMISINRE